MKRANNQCGRRRGFTLMEMLVVLGILVLLLAMVTPRILGTQKKADITTTKSQIEFLKGCLERYHLDMKGFPTTEQGLAALVTPSTTVAGSTSTRWGGPYTDSGELPVDAWGNPYQYQYPPVQGRGDYPNIWSFGPDGVCNTEDDIVSWKTTTGQPGEFLDDGLGLEEDLAGELDAGLTPGFDPGLDPATGFGPDPGGALGPNAGGAMSPPPGAGFPPNAGGAMSPQPGTGLPPGPGGATMPPPGGATMPPPGGAAPPGGF